MSFLSPEQSAAPAPATPQAAPAPPPILAPQGQKPRSKNQRTTFLGAEATANPSMVGPASGTVGSKTLLGA